MPITLDKNSLGTYGIYNRGNHCLHAATIGSALDKHYGIRGFIDIIQ